MLNIKNIFRFLSFLVLLTSFLYVVSNNIPSPFGSVRFVYGPIFLLSALILKPKVYLKQPTFLLLLFGFISLIVLENILWIHMSGWYKKMLHEEFYWQVIAITIMTYFLASKDYKGWAYISKWAFMFIIISGIMTIIATSIMPYIARQSASGFKGLTTMGLFSDRIGCGGYGYGQSLPLLFPVLIYYIKFENKTFFSKPFLLIILIFVLFVIFKIQIFANVLVSLIAIVASVLGLKRMKTSILLILVVLVLSYTVPVQIYADILSFVGNLFNRRSENYTKFLDLADFIVAPNYNFVYSEVGGRVNRYPMLFETFANSPLLGDAIYQSSFDFQMASGGHLHWMSRLALWGVFGFSFYLFVLWKIVKNILALFDETITFYYIISLLSFVSLGLMKLISGRENWLMLFVIIPGLFLLPLVSKEKRE